jgi:hypothetical protein
MIGLGMMVSGEFVFVPFVQRRGVSVNLKHSLQPGKRHLTIKKSYQIFSPRDLRGVFDHGYLFRVLRGRRRMMTRLRIQGFNWED